MNSEYAFYSVKEKVYCPVYHKDELLFIQCGTDTKGNPMFASNGCEDSCDSPECSHCILKNVRRYYDDPSLAARGPVLPQ